MKTIPLTKGYVALVDDEDYEGLKRHKWHALEGGSRVYAARTRHRETTREYLYMHRVIMAAPDDMDVDHRVHRRDEKVIDNRRENLRVSTRQENLRHKKKTTFRGSASRFKGVSWSAKSRRWRARLHLKGKEVALGLHPTEALAARAYDLAAVAEFGEFALTNFPVEGSRHWLHGPSGEGWR